jgi:hypothetical protein
MLLRNRAIDPETKTCCRESKNEQECIKNILSKEKSLQASNGKRNGRSDNQILSWGHQEVEAKKASCINLLEFASTFTEIKGEKIAQQLLQEPTKYIEACDLCWIFDPKSTDN